MLSKCHFIECLVQKYPKMTIWSSVEWNFCLGAVWRNWSSTAITAYRNEPGKVLEMYCNESEKHSRYALRYVLS